MTLREEVEEILKGRSKKEVEDIVNFGCASGSVGELVYYEDTCAFYQRHKEEIWNLILDMQLDMGEDNPFSFLANLNGAKNIGGVRQFENLLAWFAFEETTRQLLEEMNKNEEGENNTFPLGR